MPELIAEADLSADPALRTGIERSVARARRSGRTRWIAWAVEAGIANPIPCYAHAADRDRFYWERAPDDEFLCAWGSVHEIETEGRDRFRDVRAWKADLSARLDRIGAERPESAADFVGGFGFDPDAPATPEWKSFAAARFLLPEVMLERRAGRAFWTLFARVEPGSRAESVRAALEARRTDVVAAGRIREARVSCDRIPTEGGSVVAGETWPPGPTYLVRSDRKHAVFEDQVRHALREIDRGGLVKIVLARSLLVDHDGEFDVPAFLERLRGLYPTCTLVAVGRGSDTFLAATPETLVRVKGRQLETAALAGSTPRGRHPDEDRRLAEGLLGSPKENEEHRHVVEAIREGLAPFCDELEIPARPALRSLVGIQHLETPIRGRLAEGSGSGGRADILEIVEALHPTPAVCGVPAAAARDWLRSFEGLSRGWYAAPIGWLDLEGGGEFCVALRSALIRNRAATRGAPAGGRAVLFAGAGIVSGSEPEAELAETRIKLRALLAPLTEI
ncbi:MAG TPA: isochorismate synthase [Deltaproteobacteria bacterium]|nr:isochorismate synthase [Deltaproteobacteria bacterium]